MSSSRSGTVRTGQSTDADLNVIEHFIDALWVENGLSENTLAAYRRDLCGFVRWLTGQNVRLSDAGEIQLNAYLSVQYRAGRKLRSNARLLSTLRRFYRYLVREGRRRDDPSANIASPKLDRPLPHTLSEHQVEALLNAPDTRQPIGIRDRAMLELLYASGLRVSDLVTLTADRINLNQGVVKVLGKGSKERLVPVGDEALRWVALYLKEARPLLSRGASVDSLFVSRKASAITRQALWYRIRQYAVKVKISTHLSPHTLRHAFATHLVNHGANLRVVQMLLGHSDLSTTQIYTHVARERIRQLHERHHPRG